MKRLVAALLFLLAACGGGGQQRVIVAAGSTLVDSGFVDELATMFEGEHPDIELSVVGEATAQVLQLGRRGGADVLVTHAPDLEAEFVAEGLATRYELVFNSSFVIVGPPGGVAAGSVADVLQAIAAGGGPFVTRADGSGTYQVELALWAAAGIDPRDEAWYVETGQGMGLTLQVADQRRAFTLSEWGAFLAASDALSLEPLDVTGLPANPYSLIVVKDSPEREAAEVFLDWLIGPQGAVAVERVNRSLFGEIVYEPVR